jgi:hypothetical protein
MRVPPGVAGKYAAGNDNQNPCSDAVLPGCGDFPPRIGSSAVGKAIFSALFRK